jgi:ComF family protein
MKVRRLETQKLLQQIGSGLVELLFPPPVQCPACQQEDRYHQGLGRNCLRKIAFIAPPICLKCGRPKRLVAATQEFCPQCSETKYYFSAARAVAVYEGALREYLTELKYRFRPDLGEALGMLLVEWLKSHREFQNVDIMIPIPIHWQKLTVRGYNQAELLAKPLQKYLGIPIKSDIITRDKITQTQHALHKEERFANMHEAFRVINTKPLAGSRILLVDDIFTTGATVSEASRVLMRAGALDVEVLTLTAGVLDAKWLTL